MNSRQTKQHMRQDYLGPQTEFDDNLYMTLPVKVKTLYFI